jgi:hypothetical protein
VLFAAGNAGSGYYTIGAPSNAKNLIRYVIKYFSLYSVYVQCKSFAKLTFFYYSIGAPANAKNLISVGAAYRGSGLAAFSSRGPTLDGRVKPDLVVPGYSIVSSRSGTSCSTTTMSGTSMACPLLAGMATLVTQFLELKLRSSSSSSSSTATAAPHQPSAALVKATLIHGAEMISGINPYQQGFGMAKMTFLHDIMKGGDTTNGGALRMTVLDNGVDGDAAVGGETETAYVLCVVAYIEVVCGDGLQGPAVLRPYQPDVDEMI